MKEFDEPFDDIGIRAFRDKVGMALDEEIDAAYPARWIGRPVAMNRSYLFVPGDRPERKDVDGWVGKEVLNAVDKESAALGIK